MVNQLTDLDKPLLKEQIELDVKAGIKVYLCLADEVKDEVPELDFGIWDEEYLCIVRLKDNKYVQVKLSSRKKDIEDALGWRRLILSRAMRVKNVDKDIAEFIKKKS